MFCLFVFVCFTDFDEIKSILNKAAVLLCQFLDPSHILNELLSKGHLKIQDRDKIRNYPAIAERVGTLLETLQRKEKAAYFSFMAALRTERLDLFTEVINIECFYTSGMREIYIRRWPFKITFRYLNQTAFRIFPF